MQAALTGKRILITQASEFMGPALCEVLAEQGAEVVVSTADLAPPEAAAQVVAQAVRDAGASIHNQVALMDSHVSRLMVSRMMRAFSRAHFTQE